MQTGKALLSDLTTLRDVVLDASPRKCANAIKSGYQELSHKVGVKKKSFLQKQLDKLNKAVG